MARKKLSEERKQKMAEARAVTMEQRQNAMDALPE